MELNEITKEFAFMVSEDIKNKADIKTQEFLRLPANWKAWKHCLENIITNVNGRIEKMSQDVVELRRIYHDFESDPAASTINNIEKAERFKFHAEKRLVEVDRLIKLNSQGDSNLSLATFLRDAIELHRNLKHEAGVWDETDTKLWEALYGEWGF